MRTKECHKPRAKHGFVPVRSSLNACLILCVFGIVAAPNAWAQAKPDTPLGNIQPTEGLSLNIPNSTQTLDLSDSEFVGLSPSLDGINIEFPAENVGSRLFDLDVSSATCLSGEEGCERRDETLDLGYTTSITKNSDQGLDIVLTPRASVRFDDESSSAVVGALVRIGDDLREDSDLKSNTWYMFAGADAEAVTYSPNSMRRITNGEFHLQDRIIVGDAQAGVGYRIGDADLSLGYFRREVTSFGREVNSGSISFKEDAAALSFTWRR